MIPAHLTPARYKITCKCLRCDHVYTRIVTRVTDKDPPCRKKACREAAAAEDRMRMEANIRAILESERAPGIVGSTVAKAIDTTQAIVAKDYGLTDIKDNVKPGETSIPRLPVKQQEAVDNFWGGGGKKRRSNPALGAAIAAAGHRAMAGSYRPTAPTIVDYALSPSHGASLRPPIKIVAG